MGCLLCLRFRANYSLLARWAPVSLLVEPREASSILIFDQLETPTNVLPYSVIKLLGVRAKKKKKEEADTPLPLNLSQLLIFLFLFRQF